MKLVFIAVLFIFVEIEARGGGSRGGRGRGKIALFGGKKKVIKNYIRNEMTKDHFPWWSFILIAFTATLSVIAVYMSVGQNRKNWCAQRVMDLCSCCSGRSSLKHSDKRRANEERRGKEEYHALEPMDNYYLHKNNICHHQHTPRAVNNPAQCCLDNYCCNNPAPRLTTNSITSPSQCEISV